MKRFHCLMLAACVLGLSSLGVADEVSGPGHTTIRATPWGSIIKMIIKDLSR